MPAARPSSPSTRFTAFATATTHRIVSGTARSGESSTIPEPREPEVRELHAHQHEHAGDEDLRRELRERAGSAAVVDHAQPHDQRAGHEGGERARAAPVHVGEERQHEREGQPDQEARRTSRARPSSGWARRAPCGRSAGRSRRSARRAGARAASRRTSCPRSRGRRSGRRSRWRQSASRPTPAASCRGYG